MVVRRNCNSWRSIINPNDQVGTYVQPEDWNEIIQDPVWLWIKGIITKSNLEHLKVQLIQTETCQWDDFVKKLGEPCCESCHVLHGWN